MTPRFDAATLASVPGTAGSTNGKAGYPQYFVQNTAAANFANGTPMATTSWTECEAVIPPGHATATIDGVDLKLPVAHPQRILVMADTGCRMNGVLSANGSNQQNCASPTAFPWAYLAAVRVAVQTRTLIVQIGDWFYRDTNCKRGVPSGCSDPTSANYETWGDTFDSWNADVFFPRQAAAGGGTLDHGARQPRELLGAGRVAGSRCSIPIRTARRAWPAARRRPRRRWAMPRPTPPTSSRATWCRPGT